MKLELLDYQKTSVEFAKKTPYCILALEMGLGKTVSALVTSIELNSKTLIVCPTFLCLNWKAEIEKFFPEKVVSLLRHKNDFYFPVDSDFVIIPYSFLHFADILFEWADLVVYDEAQFLKNIESIRGEASHRLTYENSISRVLMLTGTPILNRVYELHSLLCLTQYDPRVVESPFLKRFPNFVEFANHFSHLTEVDIWRGRKKVRVQKWEGVKNLEELKGILSKYMIRFKSEDVLDLPQYQEHFIQVDDQDFPDLLEEFNNFKGDDSNNSVMPKIKARAALAKVPLTIEYVKSLLDKELQVIVYSDHVESAKKIAAAFRVTHIDGNTKDERRMTAATQFQRGETNVIVATIGSFSTGVNLQCAFNMVLNDFPWSVGVLEQAKFRIIRVGQKHRCQFHYMMGSYQDNYIFNRLMEKKEVIKEVLE